MEGSTKRVYGFQDMYDEIPANAKYLFSKEFVFQLDETEEQKANRIISGSSQEQISLSSYKHYYEMSEEDFAKVVKSENENPNFESKLKAFSERYNINLKK